MSKDEIKKYLTEIGKKGGLKNKEKGPEYFKWVVSQRKKNPVFTPKMWIRCESCKREIKKTKPNIRYCSDCVKLGHKNI